MTRSIPKKALSNRATVRAYIHISDTHFGSKGVDDVVPRLKMLLGAQFETFELGTKVNFIVTGDGVDSLIKVNNK